MTEDNISNISIHRGKIKSVKKVRKADNEYVYDIGMANDTKPWFFGNNILLHNSVYFSAYQLLRSDIESGSIEWNKEAVVQLYNAIGNQVNKSFPAFMERAFHCPQNRGSVIQAGRELVATTGLFIKKKRYAVLFYDKDGKRYDTDGKPGKVKAMGLDLRRSDTPKFIQDFLMRILNLVLNEHPEQEILDVISDFRVQFKERPGWEKGTPKRANNITKYLQLEETRGKTNMPGHVRAAINWNTLRRMNLDNYSMPIYDGAKVIVCKLKPNLLGFTSVAYPVDEMRLPDWFKQLPFDHAAMEETIIDLKLNNLVGVLDYDLSVTKQSELFNTLFTIK